MLDYEFDAPMFYRGANWMSSLNYYFQLQQWFHTTYNPDVEKRVFLGISGRGNYVAEAGIGEIVKEINIARSWGVKEVGFFHGYSPDGMLYCMEGAHGMLNGTEMTITKENVLDVIMEAVYLNNSFQIPVRSPIDRGVVQDYMAYDDFWDAFNLDFLNMLNPYGYVYYDLYLDLNQGFGITHVLGIVSILISLLVVKILKKNEESGELQD